MFDALTQQARHVIENAREESARLGHAYVGTEHILLALVREPAFARSGLPARLGLHADAVRAEVDKLVHRGPQETAGDGPALPLTPRARLAIQMASDEAANVSLPLAGPEHLLIGLIRDPDGVAGRVMRTLGLDADRVRAEALRVRVRQMQIVEHAVRPLHASVKRKRRVREELLAHLTAICEEEQQGGAVDPLAALDAAARRFGDPVELARELQEAVPRSERFDYRVQYWLGWRAPETVARMLLRTSFISFAIVIVLTGLPIVGGILFSPTGTDVARQLLRLCLAMSLMTPAAQFAFGWCYYKTRDAIWGAFGARRSLTAAGLWTLAAGVAVFACTMGFVLGVSDRGVPLAQSLSTAAAIGACAAVTCGVLARMRGATEIRDATWGLLPLETAS